MKEQKEAEGVTFIERVRCPYCNEVVDALSDLPHQSEGIKPKPGDVIVCVKCHNIQILKNDFTLRKAKKKELREFKRDHPDLWKFILDVQRKLEIIKTRN